MWMYKNITWIYLHTHTRTFSYSCTCSICRKKLCKLFFFLVFIVVVMFLYRPTQLKYALSNVLTTTIYNNTNIWRNSNNNNNKQTSVISCYLYYCFLNIRYHTLTNMNKKNTNYLFSLALSPPFTICTWFLPIPFFSFSCLPDFSWKALQLFVMMLPCHDAVLCEYRCLCVRVRIFVYVYNVFVLCWDWMTRNMKRKKNNNVLQTLHF